MTQPDAPTWMDLTEHTPFVDETAWVAPGVTLVGDVSIAGRVSIWYATVIRGDGAAIAIGEESNIQDGSVLHADPGIPITIGRGVSVGHRAVLHGCAVEDHVLVGMGAIIMNGARIGQGSIIAAGAVIPQGMDVPPRSLVAGVPGKVRRELSDEEYQGVVDNAATYLALTERHRALHP